MDLLAILGPITAVLTPWAVLLTTTVYPIDPFSYLMTGLVTTTSVVDLISYICICFDGPMVLSGFELARCLGNAGVLLIIGISVAARTSRLFKFGNLSSLRTLIMYRYLVLLYSQFMSLVELACSVSISIMFWGLVAGWWVIVKRYEQVPGFVYFFIVSFCVIFTTGFEISLFIAARIGEEILNTIRKVRLNTKMDFLSKYKLRKWRKVLYLTENATRPIRLPYSQGIYIDREFFLSTMLNLFSHVVDAILIDT